MKYACDSIPVVEISTAKRPCKCKLCKQEIPTAVSRVVFRDFYVSPDFHDLHFHQECLENALSKAKEGVSDV